MLTRRQFGFAALATAAAASVPAAAAPLPPSSSGWRRFVVTTRVDLAAAGTPAQAWLPVPAFADPDWVRIEGSDWAVSGNAAARSLASGEAGLLHVQWSGAGERFAELTSTVATRDRAASLGEMPDPARSLSPGERARWLRGADHAPTDGIVRDTALAITAGATGDLAKARALYDWTVAHTVRSAAVRGCGEGDVVRMLRTGDLGGKCADINPLFVALARAAGLPARDLYGLRVAPSRLGLRSLGPATPVVTGAQHCRAEVFLDGFGWTAMDPADVRKVMLEEQPGGLGPDDGRVAAARTRLFGGWEGNWLPFNAADDVALPGGGHVNFLMYPQVEAAGVRLDCYAPDQVRYRITAHELAA